MDIIELSVFASRITAICDEMGATLKRASFSPNIKDRLDFSCAIFDEAGELCAQAAHIPVHLGSMAYAMRDIVGAITWQPGDMVVLNDPYLGGTHLPDITVIAPLYSGGKLRGFVANRAHHANIGATAPGSMPLSTSLEQEGIVVPPTKLVVASEVRQEVMAALTGGASGAVEGDFSAQISANRVGVIRLQQLLEKLGAMEFANGLQALNAYAEKLARSVIEKIPDGSYHFCDVMDDDGTGSRDIPICAAVEIVGSDVKVDFSGTASQVSGNINCPLSVAAAAVFYVFRCLMPDYAPGCAGLFRPISLVAPQGCLVNARRPAAVAAGNVETSMRIVDVIIGALAQAIPEAMPAASQGTMNNLAMGSAVEPRWDYYETLGGGMGAHAKGQGLSAVQTHMTNTLNTPIESLESHYPVRVERYEVRRGSGGAGKYHGGDGLIRAFRFLKGATVTLLTERRTRKPWGCAGGTAGEAGLNTLNGKVLAGKVCLEVSKDDLLTIETPGGGGYGL